MTYREKAIENFNNHPSIMMKYTKIYIAVTCKDVEIIIKPKKNLEDLLNGITADNKYSRNQVAVEHAMNQILHWHIFCSSAPLVESTALTQTGEIDVNAQEFSVLGLHRV